MKEIVVEGYMMEKTLLYEFMIQMGGTMLPLRQSLLRVKRESDLRVLIILSVIGLLSRHL